MVIDPAPCDGPPVPLGWCERPGEPAIACRYRPGTGPAIVFLPGYKSDMDGGKAMALDAWASKSGRAMLRFDYAGCGRSEGRFEDGTLTSWLGDARAAIKRYVAGPVVLVGSSMGGWIALLLACELGRQVAAVIGVASAPDFTDWGFTDDQKATIALHGKLVQVSECDGDPHVTTERFWRSGQDNLLLGGGIAIDCPVRLVHGQCDAVVPWSIALRIAEAVGSDDVQTLLIKQGDHRLSRPQDIRSLIDIVAGLS